jgi:L-ascorbate metabolism protein UlaG (beta-lactamase superfamily)
MRVTKFSHACVRIEHGGSVVVIDPGVWSESEVALDGVDAVLITHEHADHIDADKLADALAKRPQATVFAPQAVVDKFLGEWAGLSTSVQPGQSFEAAGLAVRAYGGWHAIIHPDISRVPNNGYLVEERLYHPGDSFDVPSDASVETLFLPVSAPWLKLAESIDFVRAVRPARAFALHDCLDSEKSAMLVDGHLTQRAGCTYERLVPGSTIDA